MSYLCIKKQEPTAGAKGILCGGVFLPIESYENSAPLAGRKGLLVPVGKSVSAPPANGLVFYAPLSEESSTAETGQALTKTGTITYETLAGIPCITKGDTDAYLSAPLSVEGVFTLSFWIKTTYTGEYIGMAYVGGLCIFDASSNSNFQFSAKKNSSERIDFQGISKPLKWRDGAWHHIAMSITSTESKLYCDGTLISTASGVNISTSSHAYIGWDNDGDNAAASYSRFRIYNRILSASEIQSLALEHNPTKSLFIPLQTAYGTPQAGQKGIIVRSSQVVGYAAYSKSSEAMPTEGLVFYLPCDSDSYTTAQTGQSLSKSGTVTATTVNGIPCLEIKSGSYLSGTLDGFSGDVSMAMSFWFKRLDSNSSAYITAGNGDYSLINGNEIWGSVESDHIETACGSATIDGKRAGIYNASIGTGWHHGYFSYDATSKKFKTVLDGNTENAAYSAERSYNFSSGLTLCINSLARATSAVEGNANYSQIRIFNRALSDAEIKTLAGEYKQEEVKKIFIAVKEQSAIPEDGLFFYAPLQEDKSTAETGQALTKNGTITYQDYKGIPCVRVDGHAYLGFSTALPSGALSADWTISLWICFSSFAAESPTPFAIGERHDVGTALRVVYFSGKLCFEPVSSDPSTSQIIKPALNVWYHICIVHSGSLTTMYSDGAEKNENTFTYSFAPTYGRIGTSLYNANGYNEYNEYFDGWISAVRIYNRALYADEISALANEYTPEA